MTAVAMPILMVKPRLSRSSIGPKRIRALAQSKLNWPLPNALQRPEDAAPLIVTAVMGAADFAWADRLRRAHYPPERNLVPAHLTLFRHLPPSLGPELRDRLAEATRGAKPMARIGEVALLGSSVALIVDSADLMDIRRQLADRFVGLLTPQDQAELRLHITVQNKTTADVAKATLMALRDSISARRLEIAGIACWRYMGGPWAPVASYSFRG